MKSLAKNSPRLENYTLLKKSFFKKEVINAELYL